MMNPYFMYEPEEEKVIFREKKLDKSIFLRNFIKTAGKISLNKKKGIKVPIESIILEKVPMEKFNFDIPREIKPIRKKMYSPITLPRLGKQVGSLDALGKRKKEILRDVGFGDRLSRVGNVLMYKAKPTKDLKKYGSIASLILDKNVSKIICFNYEIKVDYGRNKNISTEIKFKNDKEINKLLKEFGKSVGVKVSEKNPILDFRISEGLVVHANYGTKYVPANFVLNREKFY